MAQARKNNRKKLIRETHQKKKVKPVKSKRGQPETSYGELKKINSFSLTPTASNLLKAVSRDLGISASELLEQVARLDNRLKVLLEVEASAED